MKIIIQEGARDGLFFAVFLRPENDEPWFRAMPFGSREESMSDVYEFVNQVAGEDIEWEHRDNRTRLLDAAEVGIPTIEHALLVTVSKAEERAAEARPPKPVEPAPKKERKVLE